MVGTVALGSAAHQSRGSGACAREREVAVQPLFGCLSFKCCYFFSCLDKRISNGLQVRAPTKPLCLISQTLEAPTCYFKKCHAVVKDWRELLRLKKTHRHVYVLVPLLASVCRKTSSVWLQCCWKPQALC